MSAVQILLYLSVAVFLIAVAVRLRKYSSTPIHLRWELYPVAHEKGRAHYGGSVFEEMNWWTKPREVDLVNELKEMAEEILLLKGVYINNRKLWVFSFPFHLGLYILIGWMGLLVAGAIMGLAGADPNGTIAGIVQGLTMATGYGGMILTLFGALGLLYRRVASSELRKYNTPAEYLNLLFFIVTLFVTLFVQLGADRNFVQLKGFVASLISLKPTPPVGAAMGLELVLGGLLIAYIPLTRMAHFVAKYFLYHDVKWSDEPNVKGGKIEGRVKRALNYGVGWDAAHIQTGKSWAEVATEEKE